MHLRLTTGHSDIHAGGKSRTPGAGWVGPPLLTGSTQANEGREDPRTEPHAPAHAAPENPTPITLEDMSDQGGVGSVSKAEATLTRLA